MTARFVLALVLVMVFSLDTLAPREALSAPMAASSSALSVRYTLDVSVDDQHQVVDARETVDANNLTSTALTSLVFEVVPRHFSGFQMGPVAVDGARVQPTFDDTVMEIPLRSPLKPNTSTRLTMSFKETVPTPGTTSYGFGDGILALGHWFPELTAYELNGWDRQHFSNVGHPLLVETADYLVTVRTDPHVVVASTGVVTGHQGGEWKIAANGVRGFALAVSRGYQSHSVNVDGTRITAYFLAEDESAGQASLEDARQSFGWLTQQLGPYGYPTLAVAQIPGLSSSDPGDEFPNVVFVPSARAPASISGDSLTYLVANETARQWCSSLVGSDGAREPWLSEGLATQLSFLFLKDRYPAAYSAQWSRLQTDYAHAVALWGRKPIDMTTADYPDESQFSGLLRSQSAIFLDHLRETMGTDTYITFLRDYVATYRGEVATTRDFLALAERYAGHPLGDLYKDYFRPESYIVTTPTATVVAIVTPTPSPTPRPSPSPVPTLAPTTTPTAVSPVTSIQPAAVPSAQPTVVSTPSATSSSGGLESVFSLVAISSLMGLALVGALSFLLLRRQP